LAAGRDDQAVRSYQLEVWWDGQAIPEVTSVSPLGSTTDVITYRDGAGGVYKLPGRTDTVPVTLHRGVSADLAFDVWATGPGLKKEVQLRFTDASDGLVVTYVLHGCWVCDYDVAADPETGAVVESLTLSVNRWERIRPPVDELAKRWAVERGAEVRHVNLANLLTGRLEETEKRLEHLLAEVESADSILLFDEADALFTRRTDVQDSHDRYQVTELDVVADRLARSDRPVFVLPQPDPPTDG
jgi:phage tail-like protein